MAVTKLYFMVGLAYIGVGLPLFFERIKPNRWYGFRTAKTLSDPRIWYAANRIAGFDLTIAGVLIMVGAVKLYILSWFYPWLPIDTLNLAGLIIVTAAVVLHSFWALSQMNSEG